MGKYPRASALPLRSRKGVTHLRGECKGGGGKKEGWFRPVADIRAVCNPVTMREMSFAILIAFIAGRGGQSEHDFAIIEATKLARPYDMEQLCSTVEH